MMPSPSSAGGPSNENEQHNRVSAGQNGTEGSPRNQQLLNPAPRTQAASNPSGGAQVSTAPATPSATGTHITAASRSIVVNGVTSTINPATQPTTSLPEVPPNFLTNEFLQSVANTLDDFDTQLFRHEDAVTGFEDFREWFNPDDLNMR